MSRNVTRQLSRPRPRLSLSYATTTGHGRPSVSRRWPPEGLEDNYIDELRIADQQALRNTRAKAAEIIAHVNKLQDAIKKIPYELRDPAIPYTYILGFYREATRKTAPRAADELVTALERVRQHLEDLQFKGYKDVKNQDTMLDEFEKEIAGWSQEKKEDTLRTWRLEGEARMTRVNDNSQRLLDFVYNVLRKRDAPEPRKPSFVSVGPQPDAAARSDTEPEKAEDEKPAAQVKAKTPAFVKAEAKPTAPAPNKAPSLADMQRELEAQIMQTTKR